MKSKKRLGSILATLAVVILMTGAVPAHHAVLQFNLEEMISTADRIFVGRCVKVQESEEMIAQGLMPVTSYTFEVSDSIKGQVMPLYTFRQLGWRPRKPKGAPGEVMMYGKVADPRTAMVHGMSYYQVGDELLLMLTPNYLQGKVTYPIGLYQGAFYFQQNSLGVKQIRNSINNQGLFTNAYNGFTKSLRQARFLRPGDLDAPIKQIQLRGGRVDELIAKRGALPAEPFVDLVRQMVKGE